MVAAVNVKSMPVFIDYFSLLARCVENRICDAQAKYQGRTT